MDNLARKQCFEEVQHVYGTVVSQQDRHFMVSSSDRQYKALKAVSCIFNPQTGDRVLVSVDPNDDCYILAILERSENQAYEAEINGPLHLKVKEGRLRLTSQEGIDMASAKDIRTMSEHLQMNAVTGRVSLHDLFFQGNLVRAQLGRLKWFVTAVDGMIERMNHRVKRLYRTVEEFEQVTAGRVDYLVKKLLSFRSTYTVMTSKQDIKVDGERIHIG